MEETEGSSPIFLWDGVYEDMTTYLYNIAYFINSYRAPNQKTGFTWWQAIFILGCCILIADVYFKIQQAHLLAEVERQHCAHHYQVNECDPQIRIPMAEEFCNQWELCMRQNSLHTALTTVLSAQLLSDIFNGLIEPLSYKSLGVVLIALCLIIRRWGGGKT